MGEQRAKASGDLALAPLCRQRRCEPSEHSRASANLRFPVCTTGLRRSLGGQRGRCGACSTFVRPAPSPRLAPGEALHSFLGVGTARAPPATASGCQAAQTGPGAPARALPGTCRACWALGGRPVLLQDCGLLGWEMGGRAGGRKGELRGGRKSRPCQPQGPGLSPSHGTCRSRLIREPAFPGVEWGAVLPRGALAGSREPGSLAWPQEEQDARAVALRGSGPG